ncbi:MAG: hypothetical protein HQ541_12485 [Mariniphaga sp.]|nr:hypothetical protein [Mariniphaga sp.]
MVRFPIINNLVNFLPPVVLAILFTLAFIPFLRHYTKFKMILIDSGGKILTIAKIV